MTPERRAELLASVERKKQALVQAGKLMLLNDHDGDLIGTVLTYYITLEEARALYGDEPLVESTPEYWYKRI